LSARGDAWAPTFASTVSAAAGHRGSWPRESAWSRCSSGFSKARGERQASRRWYGCSRRSTSSPTSYSSSGNSSATLLDDHRRSPGSSARPGVHGSCSSRRCGSGETRALRRVLGPRGSTRTRHQLLRRHLHQQPGVAELHSPEIRRCAGPVLHPHPLPRPEVEHVQLRVGEHEALKLGFDVEGGLRPDALLLSDSADPAQPATVTPRGEPAVATA